MPRLIIVCGLPGSGKTTLAKALSKQLNIVCLHKDSIKEILYESLGYSTLDDSRKLGPHSITLLFGLAKEQLKNGVDVIIEAPFYFEEDYELFKKWERDYNTRIYAVVCRVDKEIREKRFIKRERHTAHHDVDRLMVESNHDVPNLDAAYEKLPGKVINVYTDKPVEQLIKEVLTGLI